MIYQLSLGINGPAESRYAVGGIFNALKAEFPDIEEVQRFPKDGECKKLYQSIIFVSETDFSYLTGTIKWLCTSPFRPDHKRKNWFVSFSIIPEIEENADCTSDAKKQIRVERFHCGGHGGQNVNKVETGIRLIHEPTGITVTSTRQRTQEANKKEAFYRLYATLKECSKFDKAAKINLAWQQHNSLVRGNPVRVYKGINFELDNRGKHNG